MIDNKQNKIQQNILRTFHGLKCGCDCGKWKKSLRNASVSISKSSNYVPKYYASSEPPNSLSQKM